MPIARAYFLYGTLQPQAGTRIGRWIAQRVVASEPASVPGRLYAVRDGRSWYPALRRGSAGAGPVSGRVRGTLCLLSLTRSDLALMSRYEGRDYRRSCIPARTAAGTRPAMLWLWQRQLPSGSVPIRGGDFIEWLGRTGHKPYGCSVGGGRVSGSR